LSDAAQRKQGKMAFINQLCVADAGESNSVRPSVAMQSQQCWQQVQIQKIIEAKQTINLSSATTVTTMAITTINQTTQLQGHE